MEGVSLGSAAERICNLLGMSGGRVGGCASTVSFSEVVTMWKYCPAI